MVFFAKVVNVAKNSPTSIMLSELRGTRACRRKWRELNPPGNVTRTNRVRRAGITLKDTEVLSKIYFCRLLGANAQHSETSSVDEVVSRQMNYWLRLKTCVAGVHLTSKKLFADVISSRRSSVRLEEPTRKIDKPTIGVSPVYRSENQRLCCPWLWEMRAVKSLTGQLERQS